MRPNMSLIKLIALTARFSFMSLLNTIKWANKQNKETITRFNDSRLLQLNRNWQNAFWRDSLLSTNSARSTRRFLKKKVPVGRPYFSDKWGFHFLNGRNDYSCTCTRIECTCMITMHELHLVAMIGSSAFLKFFLTAHSSLNRKLRYFIKLVKHFILFYSW